MKTAPARVREEIVVSPRLPDRRSWLHFTGVAPWIKDTAFVITVLVIFGVHLVGPASPPWEYRVASMWRYVNGLPEVPPVSLRDYTEVKQSAGAHSPLTIAATPGGSRRHPHD